MTVPDSKEEPPKEPVDYARELEFIDIEIRKQVSALLKSAEQINELFGGHPPPIKEASQLISTFKRSYSLKRGTTEFMPALRDWLASRPR